MKLLIVGVISSKEDAIQIENITKRFIVGNRARFLARQIRK